MELEFDRSFEKALDKIKDKKLFEAIEFLILEYAEATTLKDLKNVRKIVGYSNYYRVKIGDYRMGIQFLKPNTIRFVTVLHRKDIYKKFP
ncbi:type II toxin-antitoxin system RelE/ParE family toxin [Salinimicrobium tongyeongense]|uniref:Type II toxin-antitoxin system RelE/ParE family toxin n=1 Tax=Salinimicrobium tongyeongense TaxID=2809707 RepID=A0ABY6NTX9_9FLAO|nr:type II toxin-antitoxin system RelE/ParE family toxin [Salinimicrobium tongyeongense]UZH56111.1 type II toxin-antitoxin system RelE/ParE family toxin [Salinimicrobium tongyeongense]